MDLAPMGADQTPGIFLNPVIFRSFVPAVVQSGTVEDKYKDLSWEHRLKGDNLLGDAVQFGVFATR